MRVFRAVLLILVLFTASAYTPRNDGEGIYKSLDTLAEIMTVARQHDPDSVENKDLVEGAINGLLQQLDPHTSFYNRDRYQTMKEDQHGTFFGIGIIVGFQNERLTVVSPLAGAPAARAGMRAGDVIAKIDEVDTKEMPVFEAIRLLRGEQGSQVDITLLRSGMDEPIKVTLERAEIPSHNVRASFMIDEKTGYVALKDFGETATEEVSEHLRRLHKKGMQQLVLDLRGNPGGLLPQAIGVSGLFIPGEKLVVSTKGRLRTANKKFYSSKTSPFEDLPLIVLINRGSASASEIVAGAIQDHDRGLILGVNSWGKGLVQSVFPLTSGNTGLALTTSRYYTPSGRNIQGSYESVEEYYNPSSSEDFFFKPQENPGHPMFKTTHGREVPEVRGITPDVYLSLTETPKPIIQLDAKHDAFFNFAAENQDMFGQVDQNWVADDKVFASFKEWLKEKKIELEVDPDSISEALITKITYQVLYTSSSIESDAWAWQYLMRSDNQVASALELFPQAVELLKVYRGESELRPDYSTDLRNYAMLHKPEPASK